MRVIPLLLFLSVLSILGGWTSQIHAAAGDADLTFSGDGKNIATLPGYTSQAQAVAVQPDGSVIVAGQAWAGGTSFVIVLTRFKPDGDLDTTFGTGGFVTYGPQSGQTYNARALKVLPDGKILLAGDYSAVFVVARFLANGTLDSTLSPNLISVGTGAQLGGMAVQADGKIVLCGQNRSQQYADADTLVIRVLPNGGLDSGFANGGTYFFYGSGNQTGRAVLIQPDGKILYAGSVNGTHSYVGRLTTTGIADSTFGNNSAGRVSISVSVSTGESVESLALDAGQNVVALSTNTGETNDVALIKLSPVGVLDPYFSGNGDLTTTLGETGAALGDLAVQADGRILITGHAPQGSNVSRVQVRRFEWNGDVDTSFGTNGLANYQVGISGTETGASILTGDGKLLVATTALEGGFLRGLGALRVDLGALLPQPAVTITQPPVSKSVNLGDPVSFSVQVASETPPVYSWYRNSTRIQQSSSPDYSLASASYSDEASYYVEVRVGSIVRTSEIVTLTIKRPPVITDITRGPVVTLANSTASLTAYVTGRQPFTFKWYKNDELFSETPSAYTSYPSIYVTGPAMNAEDEYHLVITNADGIATSEKIKVKTLPDPSFFSRPDALRSLGEELTLSPGIHSSLQARVQWSKNGKNIQGGNDGNFYIPVVAMADAGSYKARLVTLRGNAESEIMRVGVVDLRANALVAGIGKKFQITIPSAGPDLTFKWFKDDEELEGETLSSLTFDAIQSSDAGDYTCQISLGEYSSVTGVQAVTVADAAPVLTAVSLPLGRIGVRYAAPLTLPEFSSHFEVKGLPSGFTYDKVAQTITGVPSKVGKYAVSFVAVNPLGRSATVTTTLEIQPISTWVSGRFFGLFTSDVPCGDVDVTVTATGAFSGKMNLSYLNGKVISSGFSGKLSTDGSTLSEDSEPSFYTAEISIPLKGLAKFISTPTLKLQIAPEGMDVRIDMLQEVEGGENPVAIATTIYQCEWSAKNPLPAAYRGKFNVGMEAFSSYYSPRPRGNTYTTATVTDKGVATMVGKMGDGTAVTSSGPLGPYFTINHMRFLYGNYGMVYYYMTISPGTSAPDYLDAAVTGGLYWRKDAYTVKGQKNYPISFAGDVSVRSGSKYLKPNHPSGLTGPLMMDAQSSNENNLGIVAFDQQAYGTLKSNHSVAFDPSLELNPIGLKSLKFNAATGTFTGSGTTVVYEERYDEETGEFYMVTLKRPFKMEGMVCRDASSPQSFALGYTSALETYWDDATEKMYKLNTFYPVEISP